MNNISTNQNARLHEVKIVYKESLAFDVDLDDLKCFMKNGVYELNTKDEEPFEGDGYYQIDYYKNNELVDTLDVSSLSKFISKKHLVNKYGDDFFIGLPDKCVLLFALCLYMPSVRDALVEDRDGGEIISFYLDIGNPASKISNGILIGKIIALVEKALGDHF